MGQTGQGAGATNPYNVVVRAVDGDGDTQNIDVAIHVLEYHEPPKIDRVYVDAETDRVGEGHSVGDRVPTEISHWEADRTAPFRHKVRRRPGKRCPRVPR